MTVQKEGNQKVERKVKYYNLDMQKQIKEMIA
nr:MAG TPA: virulence protein RhuM family [Caudoviricetes sp.]